MTSTAPIEFYFDFSSPYGYLGSRLIGEIAERHNREVHWRPFLLGAVFKITGGKPLVNMEMKGDYARHDMERTARFLGIPFQWNPVFPFASISAARAVYWREAEAGAQAAGVLASALYHAAFGEPRDVTKAEIVADIAAECGCDRTNALAALKDPAVKERLRAEVDGAVARNVFGSPYFIADGEPFWGTDRLAQLDKWLENGGF